MELTSLFDWALFVALVCPVLTFTVSGAVLCVPVFLGYFLIYKIADYPNRRSQPMAMTDVEAKALLKMVDCLMYSVERNDRHAIQQCADAMRLFVEKTLADKTLLPTKR